MKKQLLVGAMLMGAFFTANAQDSCDDAVVLNTGITTVGEIDGDVADGCWQQNGEGSEWYMYTATENGVLRLNSNLPANEGGDTRISVYTGDCNELTCYNGSDDVYYFEDEEGNVDPSSILYTDFFIVVEEGTTYYITFDDVWSTAGFDVEVTFSGPDCAATELNEDWSNAANWVFGCWTVADTNEDEVTWSYVIDYNLDTEDFNTDPVVWVFPGAAGVEKDDYLISHELNLAAGTEYTFNVAYNGVNLQDAEGNLIPANESFEVVILGADDFMEVIGEEDEIEMTGELLTDLAGNATEGSYTFTPATAGMYVVAIHATSPADTGVLAIFEITAEGTMGVEDQLSSKFSVFPNPTSDVINIGNTENILVNGVTITDINGRTVKSAQFADVANASVNVSDLASGVYVMTVTSDKGTAVKKIVKN